MQVAEMLKQRGYVPLCFGYHKDYRRQKIYHIWMVDRQEATSWVTYDEVAHYVRPKIVKPFFMQSDRIAVLFKPEVKQMAIFKDGDIKRFNITERQKILAYVQDKR
ncbi:MAG: hypothetical protein D6746_08575 [Bacteroidetes bacterium]|nr:MAG: hypothetical protein D6746_08575 [Bacteroidota bacterium]